MQGPVTQARSVRTLLAQICIVLVIAVSLVGIFVPSIVLGLTAGAALTVYLVLAWRQFTVATWITVGLCVALLSLALLRGIDMPTLSRGLERMAFLAALLALLGALRVVASEAPEVVRAGRYLTAQPPSRRYLAMSLGGHVFGLLINLGGMAILLDMTRRSLDETSGHLPPALRTWRLRRMTTAVLRGFSLVPLWSPLGLGLNALLLAMPGLAYGDVAPAGLAAAGMFLCWGWFLDWVRAPRIPPSHRRRSVPDPADRGGLALLIVHVGSLGGLVLALHALSALGFQQALLIAVPAYSLIWAALIGRRAAGGSAAAIRRAITGTVRRFPAAAAEIGVFASAGLLSVLAVELIPIERVQALVAGYVGAPWQMVVLLNLSLFALATVGVNPIITAAVIGGLVAELDAPGLSDAAAALCLAGTWGCVMGFTPLMTTVVYAGALVRQPPMVVGFGWNGLYCLSSLVLWTVGMALVAQMGIL